MLKRRNMIILVLAAVFLSGSLMATEPAAPPAAVGQVIAESVTIDGVPVPSGTALLAPTVVDTSNNPAAIHLISGQMVELARNSSAQIDQLPEGVHVALRDGTLSYRTAGGTVETVAAPGELTFAGGQLASVRNPVRGVVAVVMEKVAQEAIALKVNDPARIQSDQPVLVWNHNKPIDTSEVHCIRKIENDQVQVAEPVASSFDEKAVLVQGEEVERAIDSGARVIGQTAPAILAGGCAAIASSAFPTAGVVGGTSAAAGTVATSAVLLANPDDELDVASSPTPDPDED